MEKLIEYFEYVGNQLLAIRPVDIIDIIIVAFIFYYTFKFVSERRAGKLMAGVFLLFVILQLSEILQMRALNFILQNVFSVGIIAVIIVFQPELRSALEKMGGGSLQGLKNKFEKDEVLVMKNCLSEICVAAENFSNTRTGALIVFERTTKLGDYIKTGTIIDAHASSFLISNIFYNKAPMHDGAVIIRDGRIHSAGCFLPLSTNSDIVKELGTRHRAAIGMSENSDSLILVVSEETGIISIAADGKLKRGFSRGTLEEYLSGFLIKDNKNTIGGRVKGKIFKRNKNEK